MTLTDVEREDLFNANIELAYTYANSHECSKHMQEDELQQEALIAMWEATRTYDSEKGEFGPYLRRVIYTKLTLAYYIYRYGAIGSNQAFQTAHAIVEKAKREGIDVDVLLEVSDASRPVTQYAHILTQKVDDFDELEEESYDNYDDVISELSFQAIVEAFDKEWAPYTIEHKQLDGEGKLALSIFRLILIEGEEITEDEISRTYGLPVDKVNHYLTDFTRSFRKFLCTSKLVSENELSGRTRRNMKATIVSRRG